MIGKLKCTYCGSDNVTEQGHCNNCDNYFNIRLGVKLGLSSQEDIERISDLRKKLTASVTAFDYRAIDEYSAEILDFLPDDFTSNYYQAYVSRVYYDDQFYIDFLTTLDFTYASGKDRDEVLRHLILTCTLNYNVYVSNYIKKFTNNEDYQKRMIALFTRETKRKEAELGIVKEDRDCFILYAEKDKDLAFDILEALEDEQIKCFIAPRNLGHNPKTRYDDIALGIKQSKCFIIVGSKNFVSSDECVKQAQFAQRSNKKIIFFKVDDNQASQVFNFKHTDIIDAIIDQYGKLEQLLLQVQINLSTEKNIIDSLTQEREKIRKRDLASDEAYRHEQAERIVKMEQVLANVNQEAKSVATDQDYIDSLKLCLYSIAFDDLIKARNELVNCERNYPNHVCTKVLNLCFLLRRIAQPNANVEVILNQIKELNAVIVNNHELLSEDEIAVYYLLKDNNMYALLIHLFHNLGDEKRLEFVKELIDYDNILSDVMFQAMLDYLLQEGFFRVAYKMISKMNHLNLDITLDKVLLKFKDGDIKLDLVDTLFKADAYTIKDSVRIEKYLQTSLDHVQTKVAVVLLASHKNILIATDTLIKSILFDCNDTKYVDPIFDLMLNENFSEDDFVLIVDHVLSKKCKTDLISLKIMTSLLEKNLQYDIDAKLVNEFLRKPYFNELTKVQMTEIITEYRITRKSYDNIMNYYLCFNQSNSEERVKILDVLFRKVQDIPITALEKYIISSNYDGDYKPLIVQMLLDLNMNPLYFSTILSNYILKSNDLDSVKKRIVSQLVNRNLTLDTQDFVNYIQDKALDSNIVRILVENGQNVKPECLEAYLLRLSSTFAFDKVIFDSLLLDKVELTGQAFANYVIFGNGADKYEKIISLSKRIDCKFTDIYLSLPFAQDLVSCNLLQAYVFVSSDDEDIATKIINFLIDSNINPLGEIKIGAKECKIKRYLQNVKPFIDSRIEKMCKIAGI